jgi:two-component system cell cycle response regulator
VQLPRNAPRNTAEPLTNLQAQNTSLRQKLDQFLSEARRNEQKLRRFERLELQLIGLSSLYDLVKSLIYPDKKDFRWDSVSLVLIDPEHELRRMLEDEGARLEEHPSLIIVSSLAELDSDYPHSLFPSVGRYRPGRHKALFPQSRPGSVTLLPLVRHGKLIGSFNIGSLDDERYVRGRRTDFFERLAAIVAICIENAANVQRLRRQGLTDTLTMINNRRFFEQRLQEEIEVAQRSETPLSCMMLDVDYFKKVNDTYGHQVGDLVLREVAALVRAQLRGSDVLARYGGEEFAALLGDTPVKTAEEVAERVRRGVEENVFQLPAGEAFTVTISIGVATYIPAGESGTTPTGGEFLVKHADRCLYQAKAAGRNAVVSTSDLTSTVKGDGGIKRYSLRPLLPWVFASLFQGSLNFLLDISNIKVTIELCRHGRWLNTRMSRVAHPLAGGLRASMRKPLPGWRGHSIAWRRGICPTLKPLARVSASINSTLGRVTAFTLARMARSWWCCWPAVPKSASLGM